MKTKSMLISTAVGALLSFGAATVLAADDAESKEKCYGIATAGENSCAANGHSCQGQAKTDADPGEWKYVAKGECANMGGSAAAPKKAS